MQPLTLCYQRSLDLEVAIVRGHPARMSYRPREVRKFQMTLRCRGCLALSWLSCAGEMPFMLGWPVRLGGFGAALVPRPWIYPSQTVDLSDSVTVCTAHRAIFVVGMSGVFLCLGWGCRWPKALIGFERPIPSPISTVFHFILLPVHLYMQQGPKLLLESVW